MPELPSTHNDVVFIHANGRKAVFESSVTYNENGAIQCAWIKEMEIQPLEEDEGPYERSVVSMKFNDHHDGLITMEMHEAYDIDVASVIWLTASQADMLADILWDMASVLRGEDRDRPNK